MTRTARSLLPLLAASAALTACASGPGGRPEEAAIITPTERYAIEVRQAPDQVAVAPSPNGLSPEQSAQLADLAARWMGSGSGAPITVQSPSGGDPKLVQGAAVLVADALTRFGVPREAIQMTSYAGAPTDPVLASFLRYEAVGPYCADKWSQLTQTRSNATHLNFGCSVTANMAAQIADPADIIQPRTMTPADAVRRQNVLDKYRKGETTAAERADQEKGTVSEAVD